jgi:hypothetical protein
MDVILLLPGHMSDKPQHTPADVPYGTLDLMVLSTVATMGRLHGYGIARRI